MSFHDDVAQVLAMVCALVLAIGFSLSYTWRRRVLERIGHPPQLERMMASYSPRRRILKAVLFTTAITLCVAAMGRPQREGESLWRKRGIDLVVVMDYSKSMLASDVYPSRLVRMNDEVEVLLDELDSDRVSIILFAGTAAHFPLTHDHKAATSLYRGITPMDMPPGSDLGEAILVARCVVRPDLYDDPGCERIGGRGGGGDPLDGQAEIEPRASEPTVTDRGRAIVVFTDGEDTEGRAAAEVERAVELGIHVFFVGVGTRSGDLIPELDEEGKVEGWKQVENPDGTTTSVVTRLDVSALKELASIAGGEGHYFFLDPKKFRASDLSAQLKRVKKGDLDKRLVRQPVEIYQWLLFPALMLLLLEACISERRRRVLYPEEPPE